MAFCPNCKVEVGSSVRHCPLCRAAVLPDDQPASAPQVYPEHVLDPEDLEKLTPAEKLRIFLELFTACSLIAVVVVVAINMLLDQRLSWSLYPLASIAYLWLLVGIPAILSGHPWLVFAVLGPSSLLFLFLIDAFDGRLDWFLPLGLAIALMLEGAVVACSVLAGVAKRKGINVIAIILSGAVLVSVGIDVALSLNSGGGLSLSWSAIVLIVGLPLSGFLFFMHYRIVNRASLRKLFHL